MVNPGRQKCGLHVSASASLRALGAQVAELFAVPPADPFTPEYVVVPTLGIRDFLRTAVAGELGVACNIQVVFPGEFTMAALGRERVADDDPWSVQALTWAVLEQMRRSAVQVPGRGGVGEARHIANLFDRYQVNRPSIIQQWAMGINGDGTEDQLGAVVPLPADQQWQADLWRAVRASIGEPSLAERVPELLAGVRSGAMAPHVPPRVVLFGLTSMPPGQLAVVRALAEVRDVHVMLVHPSAAARSASKLSLDGRLVQRRDADALSGVRHPLLRSWGRSAMETSVLMAGTAEVRDVGSPRPPGSLLTALQSSIETDCPGEPVMPFDRSVQVHACHGAVRQLEVLRDALGHLFVADHTLQAHDVVIVCPDLARFAPLAESAFGRGELPVPVRISDVGVHDDNPVAGALAHVLSTVAGRCTVADVLELCAEPPVQRALGLTIDDLALVQGWADELGTRWGLDVGHRQQFLTTAIDDATWSHSLDRLLAGAAMPAPTSRRVLDGISPYDDIDAQRFQAVGRLAVLIDRLRALRDFSLTDRTVEHWCAQFAVVLGALSHPHPDEPWDGLEVAASLDSLMRSAQGVGRSLTVGFSDMQAVIRAELAGRRGRLALRSGKVSLTSMVPVRSVPARVICVLGLEEGALRATGADGDDVLGVRPCVGERDSRAEGRALLLDALMAAGEHFIVTCDGHDITTNRALPLPVVVSELVDAVDAVTGGEGAVVEQHPRYGYDESNLAADSPFTFDGSMLLAAERLRGPSRTVGGFSERLDTVVPGEVTLTELVDACWRPARVLLRDRLDILLPRDAEPVDPHVPLTATKLQHAQLGRSLMAQRMDGGDEAEWRAASQRAGTLPPRQLAIGVLDAVSGEVAQLAAAVVDGRPDLLAAVRGVDTVDVRVELPVPRWAADDLSAPATVALIDRVERLSDTTMLRIEFSRPHHRFELAAALQLAALTVAHPNEAWRAVVVTRGERHGRPPTVINLQPVLEGRLAAAQALLAVAVDLRLRALREPIPLFEKSSREIFDDGTLSDEETFENPTRGGDRADLHNGFVWGSFSAEEMLAVPWQRGVDDGILEVRVPGFVHPSRAASYAVHLWSAVRAFVPGGPS